MIPSRNFLKVFWIALFFLGIMLGFLVGRQWPKEKIACSSPVSSDEKLTDKKINAIKYLDIKQKLNSDLLSQNNSSGMNLVKVENLNEAKKLNWEKIYSFWGSYVEELKLPDGQSLCNNIHPSLQGDCNKLSDIFDGLTQTSSVLREGIKNSAELETTYLSIIESYNGHLKSLWSFLTSDDLN